MPNYHFDVGNSGEGPIGLCARIVGATEEEALRRLQLFLDEFSEVEIKPDGIDFPNEYITVYISADNFTVLHIDDEEPDEEGRQWNGQRCKECDVMMSDGDPDTCNGCKAEESYYCPDCGSAEINAASPRHVTCLDCHYTDKSGAFLERPHPAA